MFLAKNEAHIQWFRFPVSTLHSHFDRMPPPPHNPSYAGPALRQSILFYFSVGAPVTPSPDHYNS